MVLSLSLNLDLVHDLSTACILGRIEESCSVSSIAVGCKMADNFSRSATARKSRPELGANMHHFCTSRVLPCVFVLAVHLFWIRAYGDQPYRVFIDGKPLMDFCSPSNILG